MDQKINSAFSHFGLSVQAIHHNGDTTIAVDAIRHFDGYHAERYRYQCDLPSDDDGILRFYRIINPMTGDTSDSYLCVPYL